MGMSVVRRSRRASSRPMPREAGVTNAHGCILAVYRSWSVHDCRHRNGVVGFGSRPDGMDTRNDDIVGVDRREIEFARMRSEMARAECGLHRAFEQDLDFHPTYTYSICISISIDVVPLMNMQ